MGQNVSFNGKKSMLKQGNSSDIICCCVVLFIDAQTRRNAVITNHVENYIQLNLS